jgi:hypothetical protein
MAQNVYPGGVPFYEQVFMCRALPNNTTTSYPMTRDGGTAVARQSGRLSGVGSPATTKLECDQITWDSNIVGSMIRLTSGNNAQSVRKVVTRTNNHDIVTEAFSDDCAAGDSFVVEKPARYVHKLWFKIDTDTTGGDVYIAFGGVTAGSGVVDMLQVEPSDLLVIESRDGFNAISVYTTADLSSYNFTAWGL